MGPPDSSDMGILVILTVWTRLTCTLWTGWIREATTSFCTLLRPSTNPITKSLLVVLLWDYWNSPPLMAPVVAVIGPLRALGPLVCHAQDFPTPGIPVAPPLLLTYPRRREYSFGVRFHLPHRSFCQQQAAGREASILIVSRLMINTKGGSPYSSVYFQARGKQIFKFPGDFTILKPVIQAWSHLRREKGRN